MKATILFLLITFLPVLSFADTDKEISKDNQKINKPKIELVFALDTTGSMSSLIAAAKDKIWSIANTMATAKPAPEIKIGIVGYRDRGDSYITTITEMTDDLDQVYQKLMEYRAVGGGDHPESVNQALYDAVHKNKWSTDKAKTYKVIFLVGDAPPHMDYKDDVKYKVTCAEALKKGIVINTIQCGTLSGTKQVWKRIAYLANGQYFRVAHGGDSKDYKTPYDNEIAKKSRELHETKVYYGDRKFHLMNKKKLDAVKDIYSKAKTSSIAKRSSYNMSGSGKKNLMGSQEIVDSVSNGKIKIEDIKSKELPPVMQKMTLKERKEYIEKKNKKRKKLYSELKELNKKRQTHILRIVKKEKDKGKNSLDMKIYKSIKKQAAEKEIMYKEELQY
ncbi:MAG: VWA domain-containing protein [Deltaproteobacteria bacterium]|nr:VWA domain-containing protein [Deltaproteobacteria bacterium]